MTTTTTRAHELATDPTTDRVVLTALFVDAIGCEGDCGDCDTCESRSDEDMRATILAS